VIATLLHQPNDAYATPSRVLKSDYDNVFNENCNRDMFIVCILVQRDVDRHLGTRGDELKSVRSIIRYYVSMTATCVLLKQASVPTDKTLAALLPAAVKGIDAAILDDCIAVVLDAYKKHGSTETVAKGPEMRQTILKELAARFAAVGELI
jgi:hypothetical protein